MQVAVDSEQPEYLRVPIPDVALTAQGGNLVLLNDLAKDRAVVLLYVPHPSPLRAETLRRVDGWVAALSKVGVVTVLPDLARPQPPPGAPMDVMFDPDHAAADSLGVDWRAPSAVLLGADGMLAGGPVEGVEAIGDFIHDIGEALDDQARTNRVRRTPIAISCKCITYGRVSFLEESLASFVGQEYDGRRELVIVNDYRLFTKGSGRGV